MPFTVSHASAIIPFNRKPFVLSALIVGSMSPDFLYYIPYVPNDEFTHTIKGLFVFCLPASLIFLVVYHSILKEPLISLLPYPLQTRLYNLASAFKFLPLSQLGNITLSILLGAITHIVWDSFTHGGHADQYFPWLSIPVFEMAGRTFQVYKLLQYLSTVLGLIVFSAWFARLIWIETPCASVQIKNANTGQRWLIIMIFISSLIGLTHGLTAFYENGYRHFVVQTVVGSMGAFFAFLFIYSVIWHLRSHSNRFHY